MSDGRALILTITRIEADYLRDLVEQFISSLARSVAPNRSPKIRPWPD